MNRDIRDRTDPLLAAVDANGGWHGMTDRVLRVARAHRNATGCEFPAAVEVAIALIEEEVA